MLDRVAAQVEITRAALETAAQEVADAHAAHNASCDAEFSSALAEFDRRIAEAKPSNSAIDAHAPPATPQDVAAPAQLAALQQQFLALQASQTQASAQAAAMTAALQQENARMRREAAKVGAAAGDWRQ